MILGEICSLDTSWLNIYADSKYLDDQQVWYCAAAELQLRVADQHIYV
jgi:hypothetical protein